MKAEPSKLARLVVAYFEKFGRHVPEPALRTTDATELASIIEFALATGMPLAETGWEPDYQHPYPPHGCCIELDESEQGTPAKRAGGEWIH